MVYMLLLALAPGSLTESIYDISDWRPSETLVNPHVKVATTVEEGYKDASSIENWHLYSNRTKRDYKFIRTRIQEIIQSTGWANLTTEEKKLSAEYFAVPKALRDQVYTTEEQVP